MENDSETVGRITFRTLTNMAGIGDNIPIRTEGLDPKLYRLARKKDGAVILQGAYFWQDGNNYGHEWREIPTVELEE